MAIVPLEATKDWVKLKVVHATYKNNMGISDEKIVKFFFNGKDSELIEDED